MATGSCLCKSVQYELTGEPLTTALCHCLTCRKTSGSTNTVNILIPKDQLRITAGSPKQFEEWVHESGMKMTFTFCGDCGSHLYKTGDREEFRDKVIVQAGTLDAEDALEMALPEMELYIKHRVGWLPANVTAKQNEEFGVV